MENPTASSRQAIVIGGSLGGLFAGLLLRSIGWRVDIYERSAHDLESRGGGIVLQPDVLVALVCATTPLSVSKPKSGSFSTVAAGSRGISRCAR